MVAGGFICRIRSSAATRPAGRTRPSFLRVASRLVLPRADRRERPQGRHPRGPHQDRRQHQGPRLLLPHRRRGRGWASTAGSRSTRNFSRWRRSPSINNSLSPLG